MCIRDSGDSWYIQLSKDENVIRNISFDRCDAAIDKVHKTNVTSANDVIKVFRQNNINNSIIEIAYKPVSYTHLRAHETPEHLVCRLLLEKKKKNKDNYK